MTKLVAKPDYPFYHLAIYGKVHEVEVLFAGLSYQQAAILAEQYAGESELDPVDNEVGTKFMVIRKITPDSCGYESNEEAITSLRKLIDFQDMPTDSLGTKMNVNGWNSFSIPNEKSEELKISAAKLGIKLYFPVVSNVYGLHFKISMDQQREDMALRQEKNKGLRP